VANDALASGQVVITANADRLASGLGEADKKVKHWSKGLGGNIGNELATELGKRGFAGGVLGGLIGGGIGGGLSEVVANTLGEAGVTDMINDAVKGTFNWIKGTDRVAEAVGKITAELKAAGDQMDANIKKGTERRAFFLDPADAIAHNRAQFEELRQQWFNLEEQAKPLLSQLSEITDKHHVLFTFGKRGRLVGEINAIVEAQNRLLTGMEKLNEERDKFTFTNTPFIGQALNAAMTIERVMRPQSAPGFNMMFEAMGRFARALPRADIFSDIVGFKPGGGTLPGLGTALDVLGRVAGTLPKHDVFGEAFGRNKQSGGETSLAAAVEAGTAQGYSLAVRNRVGNIEGGGDVHRQNGTKLDAIRAEIHDGIKRIEDAFRGVGIL
jgi:hypothetical protein